MKKGKAISALLICSLLFIFFSVLLGGSEKAEASTGDPNIIKYKDVVVPAGSYSYFFESNFGITSSSNEHKLTNIQYNKTTGRLTFDLDPQFALYQYTIVPPYEETNRGAILDMCVGVVSESTKDNYDYGLNPYTCDMNYGSNTAWNALKASWQSPYIFASEFVQTWNNLSLSSAVRLIQGVNNRSFSDVPVGIYVEYNAGGGYANTNWLDGTYGLYGKAIYSRVAYGYFPLYPNSPPTLSINSPNNQVLSENSSIIPVVSVADLDGSQLEIEYFLDSETEPRETRYITNTATAQTVSFSALNMSTISEGGHTLRFTVSDGSVTVQDSLVISVDKSKPVLGNVEVSSSDSQIQITGSASDTGSGLEGSPYRYTIGGQSSGWTTAPSYSAAGLTPNTSYYTKFEARDKAGHITVKEQNVYTKAQIPAISVQTTGETSLKLVINDWNVSGVKYVIQSGSSYVSQSGTLVGSPVWLTLDGKSLSVSGLNANTSYSFQAKARNNEGLETAFGAAGSGTTLAAAPGNITPEVSQHWIKLTWPATPNALGYDVEADGTVTSNGTSNTFVHNGLSPNTQHIYKVRVRNSGGTGNWSALLTKLTLTDPPAVPGQLLTLPSQRQVTFSWDLVAKATKYEVEADGNIVDNGNSNTYIHQGLQPETDHTYRVRASNPGGTSAWSAPVKQQTWPDPPATPANISAITEIHTVALKWDSMERATGYEIEVDGLISENGERSSYTHEGLDALSGHTYRIRAKNIGGKSAWSAPLDITTHPKIPDRPTNIMTTSDQTSITASWYTVPHTDSYDVEIDHNRIVNVPDNSFVHDQLAAESAHTYRIRANNISGPSEWSKLVTMTTMPEGTDALALTNMVAIVTNKSITLSWDTVAADARYDIEVDGKLLDNGSNTIYNHTGLGAEEFHVYKIRVKQGTDAGEWVAVLALSTLSNLPDAPEKIDGFAKDTSIELQWKKIDGATGYQLEIDGKVTDLAGGSSYIHNNLTSGTAHTYRIRAVNATGVTAWSPALQKSTTSPDYTLKVNKDKEYSLTLLASNVQDFSELVFTVTYDPNELELADLYDFTPVQDMSSGVIPDSNLSAVYSSGKIIFTVNQNVVPGSSWSGEITTLLFKSKINGTANVHVTVD